MSIGDIIGLLFPVAVTAAGSAYAMVVQMQEKNIERDKALEASVASLKNENKFLTLKMELIERTSSAHEVKIQKVVRAVLRIPEAGLGNDSAIDLSRKGFKDTLY